MSASRTVTSLSDDRAALIVGKQSKSLSGDSKTPGVVRRSPPVPLITTAADASIAAIVKARITYLDTHGASGLERDAVVNTGHLIELDDQRMRHTFVGILQVIFETALFGAL